MTYPTLDWNGVDRVGIQYPFSGSSDPYVRGEEMEDAIDQVVTEMHEEDRIKKSMDEQAFQQEISQAIDEAVKEHYTRTIEELIIESKSNHMFVSHMSDLIMNIIVDLSSQGIALPSTVALAQSWMKKPNG